MSKINIQDKQIAEAVEKHQLIALLPSSSYGHLHELNRRQDLRDGQYVGTVETGDRVYDCYLYQSAGSMRNAYGHSKWTIHFKGQENEADWQEQVAIGKWLLSKGVITAKEALEEYGYQE